MPIPHKTMDVITNPHPNFGFKYVKLLRAKFFKENIKMYLQSIAFLHIDMTQIVEILPYVIQLNSQLKMLLYA